MSWTECDFGQPPVGDLSFDDVSMFTAAWVMDNLYDWWFPAAQRGGDRVRPWVPGEFAVRRFLAATRRSVRLTVSGEADPDGVPYANWYDGLFQNLQYLNDNVVRPTGVGNGTRVALLTAPNGATYTGPVHVTGMAPEEVRPNGRYAYVTMDVSIPGGELELVTP